MLPVINKSYHQEQTFIQFKKVTNYLTKYLFFSSLKKHIAVLRTRYYWFKHCIDSDSGHFVSGQITIGQKEIFFYLFSFWKQQRSFLVASAWTFFLLFFFFFQYMLIFTQLTKIWRDWRAQGHQTNKESNFCASGIGVLVLPER